MKQPIQAFDRVCLKHVSATGCNLAHTSTPVIAGGSGVCKNLHHPDAYSDAPPHSIEGLANLLGQLARGFELDSGKAIALGIGYNSLSDPMKHYNPCHPTYPADEVRIPPAGSKAAPYFRPPGRGRRAQTASKAAALPPPAAPAVATRVQSAVPASLPQEGLVDPLNMLATYDLLVRKDPNLGDEIADAVVETYPDVLQRVAAMERVYKAAKH